MTWTYEPSQNLAVCNLCHSRPESWQVIAERDRAGFLARSVACRQCGLVFITPRMSAEEYSEFYRSGEYRRTVERISGKPHDCLKLYKGQAMYAAALCEWLVKAIDVSPTSRMLDIGGSTGIVANAIRWQYGVRDCTVLDPAADELVLAECYGMKTECGSLETWDARGRTWDVVIMLQTVDHLLDVAGSMRKVRSLLADDGVFIVDIVNILWLFEKCRGARFGIDKACKIDHPHGLSPHVMECFLVRAGFRIVGNAMDERGKHKFFVCRAGEVQPDAMPPRESVDKLFGLMEEVSNACVGVGRD